MTLDPAAHSCALCQEERNASRQDDQPAQTLPESREGHPIPEGEKAHGDAYHHPPGAGGDINRVIWGRELWLDREQAARELEVGVRQISKLAHAGKLRHRRFGNQLWIAKRSLDQYAAVRGNWRAGAVLGGGPALRRLGAWPPDWMQPTLPDVT